MPALPNEIILHIIKCLIPSSPPVAFAPWHLVTRTLISLTLVSSLTSRTAKHLLLKHCLYLDSEERLAKLISLRQQSLIDLTAASPEGLFLAPFPENSLDCLSIAQNVSLLLSDISGKLTRLVINMPLRCLWPEDDTYHVRSVLHEAFSSLTALEEFCSMQDELFLDTREHGQFRVWTTWPRLRCLALYNPCLNSVVFFESIRECSNLTHLVLTRADGLYYDAPADPAGYGSLAQLKRAIVVNTERALLRGMRMEDNLAPAEDTLLGKLKSAWLSKNVGRACAEKPESDNFCMAVEVPIPPDLVEDDQCDIQLCQKWVGARAIDGTLWDMSGTPFLSW
ncbi:hypothetical protein EMCG_09343 [[Emmonsia] crescens]|uniref:F-box domain-containing protein n=1 Tax=[Emmonsia] crescens TaxID=73230 RepID=A0A0G2I3H2_9EURO|nr:hypothetical protein EMCG_09343 [Emmonsia crescens UAMH 3008]